MHTHSKMDILLRDKNALGDLQHFLPRRSLPLHLGLGKGFPVSRETSARTLGADGLKMAMWALEIGAPYDSVLDGAIDEWDVAAIMGIIASRPKQGAFFRSEERAIFRAASRGEVELLETLRCIAPHFPLKHGHDLHPRIVDWLERNGVTQDDEDDLIASRIGNVRALERLWGRKSVKRWHENVLSVAMDNYRIPATEYLLRFERVHVEGTHMHWASWSGNLEICKLLMKKGVLPTIEDLEFSFCAGTNTMTWLYDHLRVETRAKAIARCMTQVAKQTKLSGMSNVLVFFDERDTSEVDFDELARLAYEHGNEICFDYAVSKGSDTAI